jgi:tripartite-type tricarboxylate transporter receptor subunit TctC
VVARRVADRIGPVLGQPIIVERVNAEMMKKLHSPEIVAKLQVMGIDAAKANTPGDFGRFLRDDAARWKKVVADARISLD